MFGLGPFSSSAWAALPDAVTFPAPAPAFGWFTVNSQPDFSGLRTQKAFAAILAAAVWPPALPPAAPVAPSFDWFAPASQPIARKLSPLLTSGPAIPVITPAQLQSIDWLQQTQVPAVRRKFVLQDAVSVLQPFQIQAVTPDTLDWFSPSPAGFRRPPGPQIYQTTGFPFPVVTPAALSFGWYEPVSTPLLTRRRFTIPIFDSVYAPRPTLTPSFDWYQSTPLPNFATRKRLSFLATISQDQDEEFPAVTVSFDWFTPVGQPAQRLRPIQVATAWTPSPLDPIHSNGSSTGGPAITGHTGGSTASNTTAGGARFIGRTSGTITIATSGGGPRGRTT